MQRSVAGNTKPACTPRRVADYDEMITNTFAACVSLCGKHAKTDEECEQSARKFRAILDRHYQAGYTWGTIRRAFREIASLCVEMIDGCKNEEDE